MYAIRSYYAQGERALDLGRPRDLRGGRRKAALRAGDQGFSGGAGIGLHAVLQAHRVADGNGAALQRLGFRIDVNKVAASYNFV